MTKHMARLKNEAIQQVIATGNCVEMILNTSKTLPIRTIRWMNVGVVNIRRQIMTQRENDKNKSNLDLSERVSQIAESDITEITPQEAFKSKKNFEEFID